MALPQQVAAEEDLLAAAPLAEAILAPLAIQKAVLQGGEALRPVPGQHDGWSAPRLAWIARGAVIAQSPGLPGLR